MSTGRKIYWDTCVFLSWLQNEERPQNIIDGIQHVLSEVREHKCILYTSSVTQIEVLRSYFTDDDAYEEYRMLFDRPNVITVAVDLRVARIASKIRDYYLSLDPPIRILTPDAIHIASAIAINADIMQTLDGCGKKRPDHILSLAGKKIAGEYDLLIETPNFAEPLFALEETIKIAEIAEQSIQESTVLALPEAQAVVTDAKGEVVEDAPKLLEESPEKKGKKK